MATRTAPTAWGAPSLPRLDVEELVATDDEAKAEDSESYPVIVAHLHHVPSVRCSTAFPGSRPPPWQVARAA